jgi:hypothetical protein
MIRSILTIVLIIGITLAGRETESSVTDNIEEGTTVTIIEVEDGEETVVDQYVVGEENEEIIKEEPIKEEAEEVELPVLPNEYIEEEYQEEEEIEEFEEEDIYADKFTDKEIKSAYYNIPNFKEKFMELQDEHEGLDIIKTKSIARGNNWKHEQECIDNADEYALERVQEIQVQGNVLQRYKEAIMYDCRVGYVSSMSDATLMGEQIWDVICDIEIPNTVVNE